MKPDKIKWLIMCSLICLLVAGCNIFDWSSSTDEDAYYEGLELFGDGKFTEAREKFEEALKEDPMRAEFRYYHAKALIMESDLNFFSIARKMSEVNQGTAANLNLPLYTRDASMSIAEELIYKNSIYTATWRSHEDLSPIYLNKTHGEFQADDVYFEFSILSLVRSVLQMRDTNNDGEISGNDWYFGIEKIGDVFSPEFTQEIIDSLA